MYLQTTHSPVALSPSSKQVQQARCPQGVAVVTLNIDWSQQILMIDECFQLTKKTALTPRVPNASKQRGQRCARVLLSFTEERGREVVGEDGLGGLQSVCKVLRSRCKAATPPSSRNTGPVFFSAPTSSSSSSTLFTYSIPSSLFARW